MLNLSDDVKGVGFELAHLGNYKKKLQLLLPLLVQLGLVGYWLPLKPPLIK